MSKCSIKEIKEFAKEMLKSVDCDVTQILYVGGSAMAMHGLRMQSEDVDVYVSPEITRSAMAAKRELESLGIQVDVVDSPYIWGNYRINPSDVMKRAEVSFEIEDDGKKIIGIALPPSYLFALKANSGRDKDIADLRLIADRISIDDILKSASEMVKMNPLVAQDFIEMVLAEIQALYLIPINKEWIKALGVDEFSEKQYMGNFCL